MRVCAFGEIGIKISPQNYTSFSSLPETLDFTYSCSEVNFLGYLSNLGWKVNFISAVSDDDLGIGAKYLLNKLKINSFYTLKMKKCKTGLSLIENGIGKRQSKEINYRYNSPVAKTNFEEYSFDKAFDHTEHFHLSAFTPSISENAMHSSIRAVRLAKEMGIEVSFNLNDEKCLWKYHVRGKKVNREQVLNEIIFYSDYLFCSGMKAEKLFKLEIKDKDYYEDDNEIIYYENLVLQLSKKFPHLKLIALLCNDSNNYGGILYKRETNQFFYSPNIDGYFKKVNIDRILDSSGCDDVFCAGFIFGLKKYIDLQYVLDFAVLSSVMKTSFKGETSYSNFQEIEALMKKNRMEGLKYNS
jgi:2-dehydro-3-deoxygluconokinase